MVALEKSILIKSKNMSSNENSFFNQINFLKRNEKNGRKSFIIFP